MTTTLTRAKPETPALDKHLVAFEAFEKALADRCPAWLRALRTSGISYLAELGFPAADQEEWRHTSPGLIASFPFATADRTAPLPLGSTIQRFWFRGLNAHRLVFLDGRYCGELSRLLPLPAGVLVGSLKHALSRQPDLLELFLGQAARHEQNSLTALNTAFLEDGAFVYIPDQIAYEVPVHLLFVSTKPATVSQPRNLFIVGGRSSVRIIEDYASLADPGCFTNAVTEIFAGESATIEHLKIQRESMTNLHVASIEARQQRQSRIISHSVSLGARLARNSINLRLEGEGCDSILNGLYVASGDQIVDHHTLADHASPHCESHEFYHGVMGDRARGVFNGRIIVQIDAQKTNAKQSNRNLLLSDDATVNTKPQLEIFADDVKCTHGATVGQLDENAMFYLRSRGIGEAKAREMLIQAFASDVLNRIGMEQARTNLQELLSQRLAGLAHNARPPVQAASAPQTSAATPL